MSVAELLKQRDWQPIPNCPGRYRLVKPTVAGDVSPEQLAESDVPPQEYHVASARDTVLVLSLTGGGLISYRRTDGSHLHTLNTEQGFTRKLRDLGIMRSESNR